MAKVDIRILSNTIPLHQGRPRIQQFRSNYFNIEFEIRPSLPRSDGGSVGKSYTLAFIFNFHFLSLNIGKKFEVWLLKL